MERAQNRLAVLQNQMDQGELTLSFSEFETPLINGEILYSIAVPEDLKASAWHVHRHNKETTRLRDAYNPPDDGLRTLYDAFENTVARQPEEKYLGTRSTGKDGKPGPYAWTSYGEAAEMRTAIGSALLNFGLKSGAKVGLCSVNCQEWILVDLACHAYGMVTVPLYDTLGPEAIDHILEHAEVEVVVCSIAVLNSMLESINKQPNTKLLVVFGQEKGASLPTPADGSTFQIKALDDLLEAGRKNTKVHTPPSPEDLALLCYTSGTTGVPKGAMITHANLCACGANHFALPQLDICKDDVHICYLPLAHIYERGSITAVTYAGGAIGFYRGDVLTLLDDIMELKPTIFTSVPRLYNRIYDRVMQAINTGNAVSKALFWRAYNSKKAAVQAGDLTGGYWGPFWDRVVFSNVKARLGGRVRVMTSGSAPLSSDVMDFLRICFGCLVIEGYGLTETTSACSSTFPEEFRAGHVGGPVPSVEIKLEDIPDMKYTNADTPHPRGEICVRGTTVFKGYYKDEKNTAEAFDEEGWFHTGDVGAWLSGGRLQIIDRKKAMFKLAQGEYVAAEKIENVIMRSKFVAQAFVYGDSLQSKLVGVVVPDMDVLKPWAAQRNLPEDPQELCNTAAVKQAVLRSAIEEGRAAKLRGFEQVAALHLCAEPFSVQNGLQTPTFKLKRPNARDRFRQEIDEMYSSLKKE